jgi:pimeloyl-ACP methyl ester carboxylesterase
MRPKDFCVNQTVVLDINGSQQTLRLCARTAGLPPLLIVQGGPGLPLLPEAGKFQQRLRLEEKFLVVYWDQRGCGRAQARDAQNVSLSQQLDDLRFVLHWLKKNTGQKVTLMGVSLGATLVLQAAEQEQGNVTAVVAVSPDTHTAISDAAAAEFLETQSRRSAKPRLAAAVKKMGPPPYLAAGAFQQRIRLLSDLGGIEQGKTFSDLLKGTLSGFLKIYGFFGLLRALGNMGRVQNKLLPELAALNLFNQPLHLQVPVHFIFGQEDPLVPWELIRRLPEAVAAEVSTLTRVAQAGHMVHFDQPEIVREVLLRVIENTGRVP